MLGYAPERVASPRAALASLPTDHPYSRVGVDAVAASLDWFKDRFAYVGSFDENFLLPTAVGAAKPSCLVPPSMAAGDLRSDAPILAVGFRMLKDFYAPLLADAVGGRAVELAVGPAERDDGNSLVFSRAFPDLVPMLPQLVKPEPGERVAFPAVLGDSWPAVQEALGCPVFEVPTLPPSVPGMRVGTRLRDALRAAGGTLRLNNVVVGAERSGSRVTGLRVRVGLRETVMGADAVVLASGGFSAGGLELSSHWEAREVALGLPVAGMPSGERFTQGYFDDHPMSRVGVAVDGKLRPDGLENVVVAGATLAGAVPWKEKSGDGISLATGYFAADVLAGARTRGGDGMNLDDLLSETLMRDSLDHCVKCTICETYCPVAAVTPLFPGPKYVGPQAERFRIGDEPSPDDSLDYCSGCGICTQVCPQGVHIAEINTQARAKMRADNGVKFRDKILGRPTLAGRLGTPVAPIANFTLSNPIARLVGEKTFGLHRKAAMPKFAGHTFQKWAKTHKPPALERRVAYFHGCGANYYEPRLGEMTVELLQHNGVAVEVPLKQDCCGLPLQSNGLFDDARKYVHKLAARLAPYARQGMDIVGTSTSCTLMLKREALEILGMGDDPELRIVSERVFDICEYLLAMHDRGELKTDFSALTEKVTYHAPCQQQGHGIGKPALELMALVPGLVVEESVANCCGVAGTYGLKEEKYQIAMDVGAGLFEQVRSNGSASCVCDSETCRWHIAHATDKPSVHPVEILHRASGL